MIELDERLKRLADSVELPATTPADDLARGRARRRRRQYGALGTAAVTAVMIVGTVVLMSGGSGEPGARPDFAGTSSSPGQRAGGQDDARRADRERQLVEAAQQAVQDARSRVLADTPRIKAALSGYRDILAEDLDPAGTHLQRGPLTNRQRSTDAQGAVDAVGTKLTWNRGGMLQVAVGHSLEGVQFFCNGACTTQTVPGATQALVLSSPGEIAVAVFQDDGDIVALTASTTFGNNGTSTRTLGLTVDQLLTAAADPRLDLPVPAADQPGAVGTQ